MILFCNTIYALPSLLAGENKWYLSLEDMGGPSMWDCIKNGLKGALGSEKKS